VKIFLGRRAHPVEAYQYTPGVIRKTDSSISPISPLNYAGRKWTLRNLSSVFDNGCLWVHSFWNKNLNDLHCGCRERGSFVETSYIRKHRHESRRTGDWQRSWAVWTRRHGQLTVVQERHSCSRLHQSVICRRTVQARELYR